MSFRHVVARGHEDESRRSSGRGGEYFQDDSSGRLVDAYGQPVTSAGSGGGAGGGQPTSYGSSVGDDYGYSHYEGGSPHGYGQEYEHGVDPNQQHYGGRR